jgi:hypothetical protein
MRTVNILSALLAIGAAIEPMSTICAEIISVTPHTACSSIAPIEIAKPRIDRPEVAPILVAQVEIASVEIAGKERVKTDTSKQETDAGLSKAMISLPCPTAAPIGVRYAPDLRREIEANYERKRPRDPAAAFLSAFLRQAAAKVEIQIWRLGVSKSGGAFLSAFVTNQNDFALQQITLRCQYVTKHGPKVLHYKLSEVFEPVSLGPATINYTDYYLGAAPPDASEADCTADEVAVWSPGEDIQSRR